MKGSATALFITGPVTVLPDRLKVYWLCRMCLWNSMDDALEFETTSRYCPKVDYSSCYSLCNYIFSLSCNHSSWY